MRDLGDIICTVFRTRWGWFGLVGSEKGLIRSCLPLEDKEAVSNSLGGVYARFFVSDHVFQEARDLVSSYFEGNCVDFSKIQTQLNGFTPFQRDVLTSLKNVSYSTKVSYKKLAQFSGHPKAIRAIGQVVAINPLPLIIPCHRVVRSDGKLGGFSAEGGIQIKQRMLDLEKSP